MSGEMHPCSPSQVDQLFQLTETKHQLQSAVRLKASGPIREQEEEEGRGVGMCICSSQNRFFNIYSSRVRAGLLAQNEKVFNKLIPPDRAPLVPLTSPGDPRTRHFRKLPFCSWTSSQHAEQKVGAGQRLLGAGVDLCSRWKTAVRLPLCVKVWRPQRPAAHLPLKGRGTDFTHPRAHTQTRTHTRASQ